MENRYGSSETEIGPSGPEPPLKPVRHIRRPEMYPSRRMQEQSASSLLQHQPQPVPRTHPRDPSTPRSSPLHKSTSTHNLTQTDTPWESITLNRCLFVAVMILLLSSVLQALGGHRTTHEEESGLTRHLGALKHRAISETQPQASLWEAVFWWLPDLTDEEDEDEESVKINRGRSKRRAADKITRSHRNRPLLENLMKPRENKLKDRRRKRTRDDSEKVDAKNKLKEMNSLEETDEGDVDEGEEDGDAPVKSKSQMNKED